MFYSRSAVVKYGNEAPVVCLCVCVCVCVCIRCLFTLTAEKELKTGSETV